MAANTIDRVKQSIRERLDELEAERDQLLRALEALNAAPSPVGRRGRPPGSGGKRGRASKRAAGRRAPRGQRRQQVIVALQAGEKGPSAIAHEIGDVNPTQISGLLRQLASEGVVTRTAGGRWQLTPAAERRAAGAGPTNESGAAADVSERAGSSPSE